MNPLAIPLGITVFIAIATIGFGAWSYFGLTDLETNFDAKVEEAVTVRQSEIRETVDAEFRELEKQPLRTYQSPSSLGSVKISYPKTWSVYAEEEGSGSKELEVYMHPGFVRSIDGDNLHALRVTLEDKQYAKVVDSYTRRIEDGDIKSTVFRSSGAKGVRLDGLIDPDITGEMVILPVRDKTLIVWTESNEFVGDFNSTILPQLTFIP